MHRRLQRFANLKMLALLARWLWSETQRESAGWVCSELANQEAELLFESSPHPCFFSSKKSLNRSDSIARRASDITRW